MSTRHALAAVDGLAQLSFVVYAMLERKVAEHDVSLAQTRLLGVLRDRRPTINQLAALLALDKSSVSGLVDRAERRGLVARARSETDRREVTVALTAQGRSLAERVAADFGREVTAMLELLSRAERDALTDTVGRLLVAHATAHGVDLFATVEPQAASRGDHGG